MKVSTVFLLEGEKVKMLRHPSIASVPFLFLISCVNMSKVVNLSVLHCLPCKEDIKNSTSQSCWEKKMS